MQTDAGEVVLIDTGFPGKYVVDAKAATGEDALGSFGRVLNLSLIHILKPIRFGCSARSWKNRSARVAKP